MASPFDSQYAGVRSRISYYANRYGIPSNVAIQQIWQESKFNPRARSWAGATGIAQFMPATARRFGVDPYNVESSLDGWGRYMRLMMGMFNGRIDLALAGYNSGENRNEYKAAAREGRPVNWSVMPAGVRSETQNYVKTILAKAGSGGVVATPSRYSTLPASTGSVGSIAGIGSATLFAAAVVGALVLAD